MKITVKQFRNLLNESVDKETIDNIYQRFSGRPKDEQVTLLQMMVNWLREKTTSTNADFRKQFAGIKNIKPKKAELEPDDVSGLFDRGLPQLEPDDVAGLFGKEKGKKPPPLPQKTPKKPSLTPTKIPSLAQLAKREKR